MKNSTPLGFALDQCLRNSELDEFAVQEVAQGGEPIRFVLFSSTYSDIRKKRPDLIIRILERYVETHGSKSLLSMARQYHFTPPILAPIRMICGFETFLVSGPESLLNYEARMARHFLGKMSAHEWLLMVSALGTPKAALRNPGAVVAYFDIHEGRRKADIL